LSNALHENSPVVSGLLVAELYAVGTVTIAASAGLSSRAGMLAGLALLLPSLALLVVAELVRSMPILIAAAAFTGAAAALGYRGSLQVVNAITPEDRRGEVVSSYLIAVYAGNSLPVIGVGLLSTASGPLAAHVIFAVAIAALAVAALATGAKYAPSP
jgi:MFS family permease